jgi:hypothetical protein
MASRNWINIYPAPETRLVALVDTLASQLGLAVAAPPADLANATAGTARPLSPPDHVTPVRDGRPSEADPTIATAAPRHETVPARPVSRLAPFLSPPAEVSQWFPLRRRDLFVLAPVLAISFFLGSTRDSGAASTGFVLSLATFLVYIVIVAVRNARSNQGLFSAASFAGYLVVMLIGLSPALLDRTAPWAGLFIWVLMLSVAANLLQVVLRKMFMQSVFRSRIEQPLMK